MSTNEPQRGTGRWHLTQAASWLDRAERTLEKSAVEDTDDAIRIELVSAAGTLAAIAHAHAALGAAINACPGLGAIRVVDQ